MNRDPTGTRTRASQGSRLYRSGFDEALDLIQLGCDEAIDYDTVCVFNAAVNALKASVINVASTVMERLRTMSYTQRR
jgi:hypothetical protein